MFKVIRVFPILNVNIHYLNTKPESVKLKY